MATSIQGECRQHQMEDLFTLLESMNQKAVDDVRKLILDDINNIGSKESWLLHTLVDHYFVTGSKQIQELLPEIRDPQSKYLLERMYEGIKSSGNKLASLQLLLHIVCRQPHWTHRIVGMPVFNSLIKCLKTETDIPVLMTAVMTLTLLLPVVPVTIVKYLNDILDIFSRLASFCVHKPANTPDVFLLHLHVALYSLFHRLYGMYPFSFLHYIQHQFTNKDLIPIYEEIIKPMLERVRLHPQLICGSKEYETSTSRWKHQETQDIVIDCAKLSLDMVEGTWDDVPYPAFIKRYQAVQEAAKSRHSSGSTSQENSNCFYPGSYLESSLILASLSVEPGVVCSPSVVIGLSTPPQSQRTTPATSFLDISGHITSYSGNTPMVTPVEVTPRETPNITDDLLSRATSRSSVFQKNTDPKRLSIGNPQSRGQSTSFDPKLTPSTQLTPGTPMSLGTPLTPGSLVMPSPMKTEFTQEPPKGAVKTHPRSAIRVLEFDVCPDKQDLDQIKKNQSEPVQCKQPLSTQTSVESATEAKSVTMDTLNDVVDEFSTHENDCIDDEVSQYTQEESLEGSFESIASPEVQQAMAESVKQFMKKVNRIRFNSLNATNNPDRLTAGDFKRLHARSNSCPPFEEENGSDETDDHVIRSTSTSAEENLVANPITSISANENTCGLSRLKLEKNRKQRHASGNSDMTDMWEPVSIGPPFSLIAQALLAPSDVGICSACHSKLLVRKPSKAHQSAEIPIFSTFSPPELLDRHLKIGGDLHAKELNRIPLTSKESVNWTHFGGVPPVDEVNILKGQNLLLHNQVMYERHKRDLHAKRNRRLLRKITQTKTLEEQNRAMADQRRIHELEIQNLTVSLRLVQEENQFFKQQKESNDYEDLVKLRTTLQANKDLEEGNIGLKNLLITQREDHDQLKVLWQQANSDLSNAEKELDILKNQVIFNQKLKEQVFKLQKEVLLMGELQEKYHEKLHNQRTCYSVKHDTNYLAQSLKAETKVLKKNLNSSTGKLQFLQSRVAELEEQLHFKEISISEMKGNLENTKVSHADEVKAVDDKYQAILHVCQQLETELLSLQSSVDQLTLKCQLQTKGCSPVIACPSSDSKTDSDWSGGSNSQQSNDSIKTVIQTDENKAKPQNKRNVMRSYSDAQLQEQQSQSHTSHVFDSLSLSSQDGASVTHDGSRSSILYTDSEDSRSNTTTDSGWWEKSTVSK